ncbi:MAG: hypothetical protein H7Z15_00525 [Rhizobacter sp.]|nr:hypothetical protein [Rhizobacter sp.]
MHSVITRRGVLLGLGATLAPLAWAQKQQQDGAETFTGFPGTRVRFASVEAGQSVLTADDEWMAATSEFQRRAVMGSAEPVTLEAFRRWNAEAVLPWPADQSTRWRVALESLVPSFTALRIPLPSEVWLIATNGQESANAPYTRANAVVLPGESTMAGYTDSMLLAHELWHVASRHAPALASRLYAEIGFEPMAPLAFPEAWAPVRIANPDAPQNRHAMQIQVGGRTPWVTPVLVAARTALQPGETFFTVMDVRLLEVEPGPVGGVSRAVLREGVPVWHALQARHDYLRRLGGNTGYVIHCEEAMADNVALLATAMEPRNPALLARIKAVLLAPR